MVAYSCNLNTQGAEVAGSQTQSQLELQGKNDSKVQKKNELPYGTFPVVIINRPVKRVLVKVWSFAMYYNAKNWPSMLHVHFITPPQSLLRIFWFNKISEQHQYILTYCIIFYTYYTLKVSDTLYVQVDMYSFTFKVFKTSTSPKILPQNLYIM